MPFEGGFGAGVELGYAIAKSIPIVCSGSCTRSIFTAFADCYDRDDQALDAVFKDLKP
jgi:nucleoside 2-deoxyribosyltransferase